MTKQNSKETKEVVEFAYSLIAEGFKFRKACGVDERYKQSLRYQNGQQKIRKRTEQQGNKVWNKYAEVFENRVAHVVGQRPKWRFKPQANDDVITADAVDQIIGDVFWDKDELEDKSEDGLWEMSHAGSVHIKTNVGQDGWPTFRVCSCTSILSDKTPSLRNARYIIHMMHVGVQEIKRVYGVDVKPEPEIEFIDKVGTFENPEVTFEAKGDYTQPSSVWAETGFSNTFDKTKWMPSIIGRALLYEIWLEDQSYEPIPFKDSEVDEEHRMFAEFQEDMPQIEENHPKHILNHQAYLQTLDAETDAVQIKLLMDHLEIHARMNQGEKRPKYPRGRVITVCQNILLRDIPNPRPMHWRKVWIKVDYTKIPGSYWGKSLGHDLIDIQDAINHRKNSIERNISMLSNGIIKISRSAAQSLRGKLKRFSNLIGKAVEVNHKDDFSVDYGSPLPPQHFQDLYHDEEFADRNVGKNEVQSGRLPGSGTAGVTVEALLREGAKRVNLAVKHWAFGLQQMARNAIEIMDVSVDDNEKIRILDKEKGYYQNITWDQLRGRMGVNDIRIDVEAFTTSREDKFQKAVLLKQLDCVDRKYVLDKIDDPDKYETMRRMDEIDTLRQYAQQLEQKVDQMGKEINTMENRLQKNQGEGNVGKQKTSD